MNLNKGHKVLVNNDSIPFFLDEELIITDEVYVQEKQVTEEELSLSNQKDNTSIIPVLNHSLLLLIRFHEKSKNLSSYKNFLSKILAAVNFRLQNADVLVLNKLSGVTPREIIDRSDAQFVIGFGLNTKDTHTFKLHTYNGKKVISACPVELLPDNKVLKSKLWPLMKEMFKLG